MFGAYFRSAGIRMFARASRPFTHAKKRMFGSGKGKGGSGLFDKYNSLLESNPMATKAITSATICGTGDVM